MKNCIGTGKTMNYTAPTGGVLSGGGYLIGAIFVVAAAGAAAGAQFAGDTEGVFSLPKATGEGAWVEGKPLFWDVANSRVSIDAAVGLPIGSAASYNGVNAGDTDVAGYVRLNGQSLAGRLLTLRKRLTIAQVNAGYTLVPAMPGLKVRMNSAKAIAVGGAAGAVTTVDVLATQAAAGVKLVAFAQASLTQSTVLTSGGAGAAVLADGASYVQNDVNTAITIGHTGAAVTTATNIDFEFTYSLE